MKSSEDSFTICIIRVKVYTPPLPDVHTIPLTVLLISSLNFLPHFLPLSPRRVVITSTPQTFILVDLSLGRRLHHGNPLT